MAQLSQSNYNSLQTPYCLFGLGRTNSYMEELFVGVSRRTVCVIVNYYHKLIYIIS